MVAECMSVVSMTDVLTPATSCPVLNLFHFLSGIHRLQESRRAIRLSSSCPRYRGRDLCNMKALEYIDLDIFPFWSPLSSLSFPSISFSTGACSVRILVAYNTKGDKL